MIDFKEVEKREVPADVEAFMRSRGGNHVSLHKGWTTRPEMSTAETLADQIAYLLQNRGKADMIRRVLGRLRRVNRDAEDKQLLEYRAAQASGGASFLE